MGCDVHAYVEIKVDGKWELYNQPRLNRNYDLFERMAGVRGDIRNAIDDPRGLPGDVSKVVLLEATYWRLDGHSYSWLTMKELNDLEDTGQKLEWWSNWEAPFGYLCGNTYCNDSINRMNKHQSIGKVEDVRLVFWFDN